MYARRSVPICTLTLPTARFARRSQPHLRSVIVKDIPVHLRSRRKITQYFHNMYPSSIQKVSLCENVQYLEKVRMIAPNSWLASLTHPPTAHPQPHHAPGQGGAPHLEQAREADAEGEEGQVWITTLIIVPTPFRLSLCSYPPARSKYHSRDHSNLPLSMYGRHR